MLKQALDKMSSVAAEINTAFHDPVYVFRIFLSLRNCTIQVKSPRISPKVIAQRRFNQVKGRSLCSLTFIKIILTVLHYTYYAVCNMSVSIDQRILLQTFSGVAAHLTHKAAQVHHTYLPLTPTQSLKYTLKPLYFQCPCQSKTV